jgi:sulfite exporter TauE/SafE
MEQIFLAFITGLTTGGLSCLAVQGGLLASSVANQIEKEVVQSDLGLHKSRTPKAKSNSKLALPIALFLLAKLVAYTALGALLGLLGSFLTFNPITRAILLVAISVFMIGNGLRLLNVHPIFRYFNLEPPKFITRYIRRRAKSKTEYATPLFLGALTVFIPCGVTQAMMAVALGTGSMLLGAALMFSFTLGTSPVFFLIAYLATQIGKRLERFFMRFVAIVVIILGFVTLNSAMNLMGSPISLAGFGGIFAPAIPEAAIEPSTNQLAQGVVEVMVKNNGYFPKKISAKANEPLALELVTNNTYSCARDFVIPALKFYQLLPNTGRITVDIPPQKAGQVIHFTCSMGMYTGDIFFEN